MGFDLSDLWRSKNAKAHLYGFVEKDLKLLCGLPGASFSGGILPHPTLP